MPDPLSSLAEEFVPSRTSYFDPAASQGVISRYANARRSRAASQDLAASAESLARAQRDRELQDRERIMRSREDEEYEAQKTAELERGRFILELGNIDRTAEDYNGQITKFYSSLPPELQDDATIRSVVAAMNAEADDIRRTRESERSKEQTFQNQMRMFEARTAAGAAGRGATEEDFLAARREDGSLDLVMLQQLAAVRRESVEAAEFDRRQKLLQENRLQLVQERDLSRRARERRPELRKFVLEDSVAFPSRVAALAASTGVPANLLKARSPAEYEAAERWDKNKMDSELSAAYAYPNMETYVELVPGLSEAQKERRRQVWRHAHNDGAVEAIETEGRTVDKTEDTPEDAGPVITIKGRKYRRVGGKVVEVLE